MHMRISANTVRLRGWFRQIRLGSVWRFMTFETRKAATNVPDEVVNPVLTVKTC